MGPGSFTGYTRRIEKTAADECAYCKEANSAEHTVLPFYRVTIGIIANVITKGADQWRTAQEMRYNLMKVKESQDRRWTEKRDREIRTDEAVKEDTMATSPIG